MLDDLLSSAAPSTRYRLSWSGVGNRLYDDRFGDSCDTPVLRSRLPVDAGSEADLLLEQLLELPGAVPLADLLTVQLLELQDAVPVKSLVEQ